MQTTRRDVLRLAGLAAGATLLNTRPRAARAQAGRADRSMRLLILGGTGFIGPHLVWAAAERGHRISIFTRGRAEADLPEGVEALVGDRDGDLDALRGREWDACIDNTGYVPRIVRDSAELLRGRVGRYLFTSSRMAYADFRAPDKTEDAPRGVLEDPTTEDVSSHYGPLKAACEDVVTELYDEAATIVRPTAVAGPGDRSERFTWWARRVRRGGDILAPGAPTDPIQYIDARDLGEFMVRLVERGHAGAFNAAGPHSDMGVGAFLNGLRALTGEPVRLVWMDWETLERMGVRSRREIPMAVPPKIPGETRSPVNNDKSIAHGLSFRPMATTAMDAMAAWDALPESERPGTSRMTPEQERRAIEAARAAAG